MVKYIPLQSISKYQTLAILNLKVFIKIEIFITNFVELQK